MYATTAAALRRPRRAQRPAAALLVEVRRVDAVELGRRGGTAIAQVWSVLALSAIVIAHDSGNRSVR